MTRYWIMPHEHYFIVAYEAKDHPGKVWVDHGARYRSVETAQRRIARDGGVYAEGECPLPQLSQADINELYWSKQPVEAYNNVARCVGRYDLMRPTADGGASIH